MSKLQKLAAFAEISDEPCTLVNEPVNQPLGHREEEQPRSERPIASQLLASSTVPPLVHEARDTRLHTGSIVPPLRLNARNEKAIQTQISLSGST